MNKKIRLFDDGWFSCLLAIVVIEILVAFYHQPQEKTVQLFPLLYFAFLLGGRQLTKGRS